MIRDIVKDQFLLSQVSLDATKEDLSIVNDLLDTIIEHKETCVGIAANMIGEPKKIMVVNDQGHYLVLINPTIIKTDKNYYETQEGCLCHEGTKPVKRYNKIKVAYYDQDFKKKIKTFTGLTSQIIQHEMDHFQGVLI